MSVRKFLSDILHLGDVEFSKTPKGMFPVGFIIYTDNSTNPGTYLGGTWEQIAQGRVLVGQDPTDADFDTAGDTGGSKTANLEHNHSISLSHSGTAVGDHASLTHSTIKSNVSAGSGLQLVSGINNHTVGAHSVTQPDAHSGNSGNGGSTTQSIMNPFYTCFIWRRTA